MNKRFSLSHIVLWLMQLIFFFDVWMLMFYLWKWIDCWFVTLLSILFLLIVRLGRIAIYNGFGIVGFLWYEIKFIYYGYDLGFVFVLFYIWWKQSTFMSTDGKSMMKITIFTMHYLSEFDCFCVLLPNGLFRKQYLVKMVVFFHRVKSEWDWKLVYLCYCIVQIQTLFRWLLAFGLDWIEQS